MIDSKIMEITKSILKDFGNTYFSDNIETATLEATAFDTPQISGMNETRLVKIDDALVKKAMARNPFFRFNIMNYKRQRGTNKFIGLSIKEAIQDYQKRVPINYTGTGVHELIQTYDYKKATWFVYNEAIVDKLEHSLIELIQGYIEELQNQYKDVYLIRSDERNAQLKLHEFTGDVSHYAGFLPDFVLYLANESHIYQIYIEPKGE